MIFFFFSSRRRHTRWPRDWSSDVCSSDLPQRAHTVLLSTENSVQQTSQMGTEERCGRGEPQREHEDGKRAQLKASMGLRNTRTTARQREVSEVGTSHVSELESLLKTHLTFGWQASTPDALPPVYAQRAGDSISFRSCC